MQTIRRQESFFHLNNPTVDFIFRRQKIGRTKDALTHRRLIGGGKRYISIRSNSKRIYPTMIIGVIYCSTPILFEAYYLMPLVDGVAHRFG